MLGADLPQLIATALIAGLSSAAFWGFIRDRRKAKAKGAVATATVEIQVEASRVANLEQRFAFAQRAWDDERESLTRQIERLAELLEVERRERAEEEQRHLTQIAVLEARVRGMQRELGDVHDTLTGLRRVRGKGPDER